MTVLAVSAIGADRPGIVASVTGVLYQHGCNLEDTEMAVLRGHFAMMLVVSAPESLTAEELEGALTEAAGSDLVVAVRTIDDGVPASPSGDRWWVAVYGADRPGIVHGVTSLLAEAGANILDLETRVIGEAARPVYAMLLEITVPSDVDGDALAAQLADHGRALGVECTMRPAEADVF